MFLRYVILFYLLCGSVFSVLFLSRFIATLDDAASETRWTFKLIIFPGCVVLWPVLLAKYVTKRTR